MSTCKICSGEFRHSPDSVVVCDHHQGAVHYGCCAEKCSWNHKPCENAQGVYAKVIEKK